MSSLCLFTLQEYAFGNPVLGISRKIHPHLGLQGYRKALLEAMKKHGRPWVSEAVCVRLSLAS